LGGTGAILRTVFLLTGFNNWGKTYLIRKLFHDQKHDRQRFEKNVLYPFGGQDFCVMPLSNDDLGEPRYEKDYQERMALLKKAKKNPSFILSAFCPTQELNNSSTRIIQKLYKDDRVIMIPIEYKWCGQAKLLLKAIHEHYEDAPTVEIQPITQAAPEQKLKRLQEIVQAALP
jgi:hypothetical protein